MKVNRSNDTWKFVFPQKSMKSLAICLSLLVCLITNSTQAQVTNSTEKVNEPVDPVREKQKEIYFKELKEGQIAPIVEKEIPQNIEPIDPAREQQKADYEAGKLNNLPEALPVWKDTGNHEADEAAYRLAVNGWIKRNGALYEKEEIEFLLKPVLKLEEREQTLKNL